MKKALTICAVLLLVSATLFAAPTFSGRFRQGYTFKFADSKTTVDPWKNYEAKLAMKFADENGIWEIAFGNDGDGKASFDSNDKWGANATVDVTKALATKGVDLGEFSLKTSFGANTAMTALSAYVDNNGSELYKLRNNGKATAQLSIGYGSLVTANIAVDPTNAGRSLVASIKTTPVEGVTAAAAYAYKGTINNKAIAAKNVAGASVDINVQKLAKLVFKLGVTAYDNVAFGDTTINAFAANIYGGIDAVDGYAEIVMKNADKTTVGLNVGVNFNVVTDLGLDAYLSIADFSAASEFTVGGDVSYKLAGVELALNAEYANKDKAFSLTPKMIIVF